MITKLYPLLPLLTLLAPLPALAAVNVVASTPDVAWLVQRVGGEEVKVQTLANSSGSYHFVEARPDFALKVARADVLCRVGLELEDAWLNKVVDRAANQRVMPNADGDCTLGRRVEVGEKPAAGTVTRAQGDVHASGNPHFWLSPAEMARAATEVEEKLSRADAKHSADYAARREALVKELTALEAKLKEKLKPAAARPLLQYHRDFFYYFRSYGIRSLGSIEEIPGVQPSGARLGQVAASAKREHAAAALATLYDPQNALDKFSELSGAPVLRVPSSVPNPADPASYAAWQEELAERVLKAGAEKAGS